MTIYSEYKKPTRFQTGARAELIYALVEEIMRRAGVGTPIEAVTWKRGYAEALNRPCVGLFPTTRTKEREQLFHWIGPIVQVEWIFYGLSDSGLKINSLEDAKNVKSIGIYSLDSKGQWLKAQGFTNLDEVIENETNIKKLYNRRIDLMPGSPPATDELPAKFGYDTKQLIQLYTFKTVDLYLAVSLGTPDEAVTRLHTAFQSMVDDGTMNDLYKKWAPNMVPPITQND